MGTVDVDTLQNRLQEAHLLYLRGDLARAHCILDDLKRRCPGNAEVERLLAEVVIKQPPTASAPAPTRRDWTQAITKDLPPSVSGAVLFGLFIVGCAVYDLVSALLAGVSRGFLSAVTLLVPLGRRGIAIEMPAWATVTTSLAIASLGALLLYACWRSVLKTMESPA